MNKLLLTRIFLSMWILLLPAGNSWAHVTPNVKLVTTREALSRLLPADGKLLMKKVQLSNEQFKHLDSQGNWHSHDTDYTFFVMRDRNNRLERAAVFITEYTRHGPMVVAVALDSSGRVTDAVVTDIQMEILEWVGPLIRKDYLKELRGKGSDMELKLDPRWETGTTGMTQSYAIILTNAVKRSAQLFDLVF